MASRAGFHYPTLAQLILSACGGLFGLFAAALLLLMGGLNLVSGNTTSQTTSLLNLAGGTALVGLLCLPSAVYAMLRLLERPLPDWRRMPGIRLFAIGLPVLWGMALVLAAVVIGHPAETFVIPIIYPVVVGVPIAWLLLIAGRGLLLGGPQRRWGTVSPSLTGTLITVLVTEVLVLGVLILIFAFWLAANPDQMAYFQNFAAVVETVEAQDSMDVMLRQLFQYPGVVPGLITLAAVVIPMMEELIKPLALYFLLGRRLTPAQGFVGGLICGACFALTESIGSLSQVADSSSWIMLAIGRSGTALLHITCTGLVGWGVVSAFTERRWGRFFLAFLGAVALHGTWNAATIAQSVSTFMDGALWKTLGALSPVMLGIVAMSNLIILLVMNRRLQPPVEAPAVAPAGMDA